MANIVKVLVEGGKATPGPPLGPALGPLGVNIGQVVKDINEMTKPYAGMQVPVTVTVDSATRNYTIEVGIPPTSALILKELNIQKGSGKPKYENVGNLSLEQVIKIAKIKFSKSQSYTLKGMVLEVLGTCISVGVTVDKKDAKTVQQQIKDGVIVIPET